MLKTVIPAIALSISLLAAQSTQADIILSCTGRGSPCAQGPDPNSWYIPAIGENEPSSEQEMSVHFIGTGAQAGATFREVTTSRGGTVSLPANSRVGFFDVLESDGSLSDVVTVLGEGAGNVIVIESDPPSNPFGFIRIGANLGILAIEGDSGVGATMGIPLINSTGNSLGALGLIFGFDGELVFPFGPIGDTSDFVRVVVATPEPASLAVLGFGLAALAYLLHRRRSRFNYSI